MPDLLLDTEFDRQSDTLIELGYPALAGLDVADFRQLLEPLRDVLRPRAAKPFSPTPARASFVLVVDGLTVPTSVRVPLLRYKGHPGALGRTFPDADTFRSTVDLPAPPVYALLEVERGEEFCGMRPAEAAQLIAGRRRTPITMDEGLCWLHASPASLAPNKCFHTAASRGDDKRVPAVWISKNAPTLGWCWENNHHTWLGVASAGGRVGVPPSAGQATP